MGFLTASFLLSTVVAPANAATLDELIVAPGGGGFSKIQDAIDAAEDGDRILIFPGRYRENLIIDVDVDLIGFSSLGQPVIVDGRGLGATITIEQDVETLIRDLTITGGQELGVDLSGVAVLRDCIVRGNTGTGTNPGAIYVRDGSLDLRSCVVADNHGGFGGGIRLVFSTQVNITDSLFARNVADRIGGAILNDGALTVNNTRFVDNECLGSAGALSSGCDTTTFLTDCVFENNSAQRAGALNYGDGDAGLRVTRCRFEGNSATEEGGAACMAGGGVFTEAEFLGNQSAGIGGAIFLEGSDPSDANLEFLACRFEGNQAGSDGGALAIRSDDTGACVRFSDSTVSSNQAGGSGGGLFADLSDIGSIEFAAERTTFSGNTCSNDGGAIYGRRIDLELSNSTFSGNQANRGGAFHLQGTFRVTHSTLAFNTAVRGGAFFLTGNTTGRIGASVLASNGGGTFALRNRIGAPPRALPLISDGYNVVDDRSAWANAAGDLRQAVVGLLPLGDYGGPTQTHALIPGSNALDRVPAALCTATEDQRGEPRPSGTGCDSGAFEDQQ